MKDLLPSRRDVLRAGAALAASVSLTGIAAAFAEGELAPITKPIPATGEQLPVIGLGTNQFGVKTPEEMKPLQEVLETMAKMGGKVVDTARGYGRSEEVIGELLERMGNRDKFFISTKMPIRGELLPAEQELQEAFDR